jgi:starch synthase
VPIVRDTGGLKDTVTNFTPARLARGTATGFTFRKLEPVALAKAVKAAAQLFFSDPGAWRSLVQACMRIDHGWSARAQEYAALYRALVSGTSFGSAQGG